MKKQFGFSLMELLIVVAIVGIIAAIAIPSYQSYLIRSNRSDAIHTMLAMQLAQEKYRMNNTSYGTLAQVWSGVSVTEGGHYNLAISNVSATTYTITATATGSQSGDAEGATSCATLRLAYANGTTTKTPAACWFEG